LKSAYKDKSLKKKTYVFSELIMFFFCLQRWPKGKILL
jgi:hypothetical protein